VTQRGDRDVNLRAFSPPGSIVACLRAALGRGLQRAAIDADRRRLALVPAPLAQKRTHILHQQLKAACLNPALPLLIHHPPRRQIAR
jgi:hypothetical protein